MQDVVIKLKVMQDVVIKLKVIGLYNKKFHCNKLQMLQKNIL